MKEQHPLASLSSSKETDIKTEIPGPSTIGIRDFLLDHDLFGKSLIIDTYMHKIYSRVNVL